MRDDLVTSSVSVTTRSHLLELTSSKGWLYSLNVTTIASHGIRKEKPDQLVLLQLKRMRSATSRIPDYEAKGVYNLNEKALYYGKAPTKTISKKPISGVERQEAFDCHCGRKR